LFLLAIVLNECMLRLQTRVVLVGERNAMHRCLRQTFENETAFTIGVISLGFLGVGMAVAVLFVG